MNITAEKEEIIRKFNLVHDVDLIRTIKNLLETGLRNQSERDKKNKIALHASIDRALSESEKGLGRPYEEFMAEIRKKYQA